MKKLLLLGLAAALSACMSPPKIPPVQNPGGEDDFVWHDLISNAPETSEHFYRELFGWTFTEIGKRYHLITDAEGSRIGGLVENEAEAEENQNAVWLSVIQVEDLNSTLEKIKANGGAVLKDAENIPDRGRIAIVADPEGAVLQLLEHSLDAAPYEHSPWIWHELISEDPAAAAAWYADVSGMAVEKSEDGKRFILKEGDRMLASISQNPFEDTRSQWIPVLAVSGFDAIAGKVEPLGGKLQELPAATGKTALLLDPNNAPLVIQEKGEDR